jgi:hypothetical protein
MARLAVALRVDLGGVYNGSGGGPEPLEASAYPGSKVSMISSGALDE